MRAIFIAYSAGVLLATLSQNPGLLAAVSLVLAVMLAAMALSIGKRQTSLSSGIRHGSRSLWITSSLLFGLAYHALWAGHALSSRLPHELAGETLSVQGEVISIPREGSRATGFLFRIHDGPSSLVNHVVRLSDYEELGVRAGQRWHFRLRLHPPHGFANPGGFDREAWFLQQGVVATGYVLSEEASLLQQPRLSMAAFRGSLLQRMDGFLPPTSHARAILPALLLGHDARLTPELRQLFVRTGTSHLFVISGLHIGLMAACALFLVDRTARLCSWFSTRIAVQQIASWVALMVAVLYALISGFELPAQRALIMLAVFLIAGVWRLSVNVWLRYWLAMALVLTLNPLAASAAGFWLSFVAVAVLLLTVSGSVERSGISSLLQPQLAIFVGLFLPLAFWMGQISLLAPLINLIAIPVIGLLIVPLGLLALLCSVLHESLGELLFKALIFLLDEFIRGLRFSLEFLPGLPQLAELHLPAVGSLQLLLGVVAVTLLLLPWPLRWRWLALPLLMPSIVGLRPPLAVSPERDDLVIRVFDVGQGLSVLASASGRHLLYDTGAGAEQGFSMADSVILPALRDLGVNRLDKLIISHWDNDHAGGVPALRRFQPGLQILASDTVSEQTRAAVGDFGICRAGQAWQWGRVRFEILHPAGQQSAGNDNSCVLQILIGEQGVLVPGDISRHIEHDLASRFSVSLASTIIVAPHHGSQTSSSFPLLKMADPDWVVFSAGASNSFGHPSSKVVNRYAEAGVGLLSTANSGMISFRLTGAAAEVYPERYRVTHRRYWRRSQNDYWCRYTEQVCDTLSR